MSAGKAKVSWSETVRAGKAEAILDAARLVFEERGLEGATVRAIAEQAGCTTGAIYPLFESKEQIYAELLQRSLRALHDRVSRSAAAADPAIAHEAAAKAFLDYYRERPFEVNLGLYAFGGLRRAGVGPSLDRKLNELLGATVRLFAKNGGAAADVPPPDAMMVFAQLIGLLVLNLAGRLKMGRAEPASILELFLSSFAGTRADATSRSNPRAMERKR